MGKEIEMVAGWAAGDLGSMPVEGGAIWASATGPGGGSVVGHLNPRRNMSSFVVLFFYFFIHIHVHVIYYVCI